MRFWDSPNSPYPYCQQNMDLYWPLFSSKNEQTTFTCPEFVFYTDDQYQDHCSVTYPGLASNTHPTRTGDSAGDLPIQTQYSVLEQGPSATQSVVKQCGLGQTQVTIGAGSEDQACMLQAAGTCSNSSVVYCSQGVDHVCSRGFTQVAQADLTGITANDCSAVCPEGQVCS